MGCNSMDYAICLTYAIMSIMMVMIMDKLKNLLSLSLSLS